MDYEPFSGVESRPAPRGGFQFSLLALFLLMTVAALLVGGMVALAAALGVDATSAVFQTLSQQIIQLPRSAVLLVAVVMLYNRGPLASHAARYGLIGFGGLLLLTVLGTGFQIVVQAVVVGNSGRWSASSIGLVFSIYGFITSALMAVCYGFLLAAILARRTDDAVAPASWEHTPRPADES